MISSIAAREDVEALTFKRPPSSIIEPGSDFLSSRVRMLRRSMPRTSARAWYADLSQSASHDNHVSAGLIQTLFLSNADDDMSMPWKDMWAGATGGTHANRPQSPFATASPPLARSRMRVERLTAIQASFGLPVQSLAEILKVSRPQLYKWLDPTKDIVLQEDKLRRLALVEDLAKEWRARSAAPLSQVSREPLDQGKTIVALLSATKIDRAAVANAFDKLAAMLAQRGQSESQRMADAGFARRPSHRALPLDE